METNRDYLSYSQYALFKSSPKAYYEKYVLGKEQFGTKYQNFGKKLMEDLEFGQNDMSIPKPLRDLAKERVLEHEITIKKDNLEKDLFGIVDVVGSDFEHFWEIKTGKHPWSESDVAKNEQMLFYALMIGLKYNTTPTATLVWAETRDDEEGNVVIFTGNTKVFERIFTTEELSDFYLEIEKTIKEMSEYEHSILEVENDKDARLLYLITEKKRIDEELDLLKAEIMLELSEFQNKYASSENFNITLASRKSYTYSTGLTDSIKQTASDFKLLKTKEEKNGTAVQKATQYLLIKAKK
tara:strand:+ start:3120 stop:4010 length:891 start_codon:yes stop_codon:yes gene_type:complete